MSEQSEHVPEWGQKLAGWNAAVWRTSTASLTMRSAIMGVFLLEHTPDVAALRARMERATRQFPALRQRVVSPIGGIGQPRMVVDPGFDIGLHVSRYTLPKPGSWAQLLQHARRESLYDFDRDRPLWRASLVEGLEGGRAAILLLVHHAIADGQGAVLMLAGLVDWTADAPPAGADLPPEPAPGRPDRLTATLAAVGSAAKRAGSTGMAAVGQIPGTAASLATHPRRTTRQAARFSASASRVLRPHRRPLSPLLRQRGTTYSSATMDVPFPALRQAASAHAGTINDAFLAAVTGGLRRYHELHGSDVGALRLNVPVSTRLAGQDATVNAVAIARVELDASETDVAARFVEAQQAVTTARDEPVLPFADLAADASRLLPVGVVAAIARASDVTASNVPGLPARVWLGGAPLLRLYPIVPTLGSAANITMLSYAREHCSIGVSTDDIAIRDLDGFMRCLADGFAEIGAGPEPDPFDPLAP